MAVFVDPSRYRAVLRTSATLTISAGLALIISLSTQATERWFLMSRHGECAEVSTLKRKVPDLGGVNDPAAFATFMRGKGYTVTSTPVSVPKGKAQEVRVPDRDLFLMFVTSDMCDGSGGR